MQWLLPPILWAGMVAATWLQASRLPGPALFPDEMAGWGWAIALLGAAILLGSWLQFLRAKTTINTFQEPIHLLTTGFYAWSRNPMYLGFALALLGFAITRNDLISLLWPSVFFAASQWWYIPFEEEAAARVFGERYGSYRRQVRRWI